jgi:hypothetical protein
MAIAIPEGLLAYIIKIKTVFGETGVLYKERIV